MGDPVRLGRYVLEHRLAVGGMAEVFLARLEGPEGFHRSVVVKRVLPHLSTRSEIVDLFLREARLAARLNHPGLVQVYELAELDGQYCLVMEFIDGTDLAVLLDACVARNEKIPVEIAAFVVADAAEALHYAHEACGEDGAPLNVVHSDVSPANIIVTRHGKVKVVDFGIAQHDDAASTQGVPSVRGKHAYVSPEQVFGRAIDRRSDVFSLGIVLYELVTSAPCFGQPGASAAATLQAVGRVSYEPPRRLRPDLPPAIEECIVTMLARDPGARFATAAEAARALRLYLSTSGGVSADEVATFVERLVAGRRGRERRVTRTTQLLASRDEVLVDRAFTPPEIQLDAASHQRILAMAGAGAFTPPPPRQPGAATVPLGGAPKSRRRRIGVGVVATLAVLATLTLISFAFNWQGAPRKAASVEPLAAPVPAVAVPPSLGEPEPPVASSDGVEAAKSEDARARTALLTLESTPLAEVSWRGKSLGVTPLRGVRLPVGTHLLSLRAVGGDATKRITVTLAPGQHLHKSVAVGKGRVILHVDPWAVVYSGDRKLGTTPLPPIELDAGPHVLRLVNPELGAEQQVRVDVVPGKTERIEVKLP